MDEPTRRAWSKPELIVIVRSGPEEAVLTGCKTGEGPSSGPASSHTAPCYPVVQSGGSCDWCDAYTGT